MCQRGAAFPSSLRYSPVSHSCKHECVLSQSMSHAKWGLWLDGLQTCGIFGYYSSFECKRFRSLIWCSASLTVRMNLLDLRSAVYYWYENFLPRLLLLLLLLLWWLSILLTVLKIPARPLCIHFFLAQDQDRVAGEQRHTYTHTHTRAHTHTHTHTHTHLHSLLNKHTYTVT